MTTLADLLTKARTDSLVDTGATQKYSDAQLTRWINEGIAELWPHCWVAATDATTVIVGTTPTVGGLYVHKRYDLPTAIATYPNVECVRRVELGPVGGYHVATSQNQTDSWRLLKRTWPRNGPAWMVDYGARELVVSAGVGLMYDQSDHCRYYLRLYYVRPPAALSAAGDTFEAPDSVIPFLVQTVRLRAFQSRQPRRITDAEQSGTLGSIIKGIEDERELLRRTLVRPARPMPKLVR